MPMMVLKYHVQKLMHVAISFGFKDELQEDHGQTYGYVLRVEDQLQHHVKVMPDGNVESEMEPPPAYPAAHLNPKHIYSAHQETEQVLRLARIRYDVMTPISSTCINPKIIKPNKPTRATGFVAGGILGIVVYTILVTICAKQTKKFRWYEA